MEVLRPRLSLPKVFPKAEGYTCPREGQHHAGLGGRGPRSAAGQYHPPGSTRMTWGGARLVSTHIEGDLPCAPYRCQAPSPSLSLLLSLKSPQMAGSAETLEPGSGAGRRALTPLLPQVLCILPHPQLGLHTGFRLVQDILGRAQHHTQVSATKTLPTCRSWSRVGL